MTNVRDWHWVYRCACKNEYLDGPHPEACPFCGGTFARLPRRLITAPPVPPTLWERIFGRKNWPASRWEYRDGKKTWWEEHRAPRVGP